MLKNIQERVPAMGIVCIGGEGAATEQGCGGRNDSGLCRRWYGDLPALLGGAVGRLAKFRAGGIQVLPLGASLSLYTVLGFPHLLVLSPSSLYLLTRHQEVHGQGTQRAAR